MWESVVALIVNAVTGVFTWFDRIIDAIPGSWATVLSFFVMLSVTRFVMGSLVGTGFGSGGIIGMLGDRSSDRAKKSKSSKQKSFGPYVRRHTTSTTSTHSGSEISYTK